MTRDDDKKLLLWVGVIIATIAIVIARVVTLKKTLLTKNGKIFNIVQPIKNITRTVSDDYTELKSAINKINIPAPVINPSPAPVTINNDMIPLVKARLEQELNNKTIIKTP